MENRKPPSEREMAEWLAGRRLDLRPLCVRLTKTQPRLGQTQLADFEIEATWDKEKARFLVEYKSLSTPKAFAEAVRQVEALPRTGGAYPMVMLPFLREAHLQELERRGISGIDLSGNGVVIIPRRLLLYRTGNPNRFRSSAPIKNVYRKNTSMVGRSFLATPAYPTVRDVCNAVNARNLLVRTGARTPMRIGTVSKAITALEQDLIVARSDGYRLLQADKLLETLAENYEPAGRSRRVRLKVDTKGKNLARWVVDRTRPSSLTWIVTGLSSVGRYAVMAREETLALYCTKLDDMRALVGGSETERFPNLELIEAEDEPVYFDGQEYKNVLWASPTQCYLELMAGDKRDRETAEQVKAHVLNRIGGGPT